MQGTVDQDAVTSGATVPPIPSTVGSNTATTQMPSNTHTQVTMTPGATPSPETAFLAAALSPALVPLPSALASTATQTTGPIAPSTPMVTIILLLSALDPLLGVLSEVLLRSSLSLA